MGNYSSLGRAALPSPELFRYPQPHGFWHRDETQQPKFPYAPGRYGRLMWVPNEVRAPDSAGLKALVNAMLDVSGVAGDNPDVAAGYTYLGQFIDHDITFDTTTLPEQRVDPATVYNYRTPKLDLDSLYGLGPTVAPYLYQKPNRVNNRAKFLIGEVGTDPFNGKPWSPQDTRRDLPRNPEGYALIADPRNDSNLIIAQLHLAFMKFHNAMAEQLGDSASFEEVRQQVTWCYQYLIVNDYLPKVVDPGVLKSVLEEGRKYYVFDSEPYIPVEFSMAAFRFGHSMVRERYEYNSFFKGVKAAPLNDLLRLTGPFGHAQRPDGTAPTRLPWEWVIDWNGFFPPTGYKVINPSRKVDCQLSPALHGLPDDKVPDPMRSLPLRTLTRGARVGLPTGQKLAACLDVQPLTAAMIAQSGRDGDVAAQYGMHKHTPLWYYLLKEAEVVAKGKHLGPLGSRVVAEVLIGILQGDRYSYLRQSPTWKPDLPHAGHTFEMSDLIAFAFRA